MHQKPLLFPEFKNVVLIFILISIDNFNFFKKLFFSIQIIDNLSTLIQKIIFEDSSL